MSDKFHPCPFCHDPHTDKSLHVITVTPTPDTKSDFAVTCDKCDCLGPWAFTRKIAIELWNYAITRTEPDEKTATRLRRSVLRSRRRKNRDTKKPKGESV